MPVRCPSPARPSSRGTTPGMHRGCLASSHGTPHHTSRCIGPAPRGRVGPTSSGRLRRWQRMLRTTQATGPAAGWRAIWRDTPCAATTGAGPCAMPRRGRVGRRHPADPSARRAGGEARGRRGCGGGRRRRCHAGRQAERAQPDAAGTPARTSGRVWCRVVQSICGGGRGGGSRGGSPDDGLMRQAHPPCQPDRREADVDA